MRVAVVGLGYWGPNLVRNLHALDACDSVVACDLDEARVKNVLRNFPSTVGVTDYMDVLSDPHIDAVVIATPVRTHAELATQALQAGKSVLIEKPISTSSHEARAIMELATERGLLAMAGHTFLFNPAVLTVQRLIQEGQVGEAFYVQSSRVGLEFYRSDVSVLWDFAPHDLSIMLAWLGEFPVLVSASGRSSHPRVPTDVAFIDLEFPSGCVANLHLSWLGPTKVRRVTLVGSRRMVVYEDTNPEEPVKIFDKGFDLPPPEDFGQYKMTYRTGDVVSPRVEPTEPLRAEVENFLDRVVRGEIPDHREDAAVRIVAIIEAAERSLEQKGVPVQI